MGTSIVQSDKKLTAFRLSKDLVERLKILASRDHRSLNNFVEKILMSIVYDENNPITVDTPLDTKENNNPDTFDMEAFKSYVESL